MHWHSRECAHVLHPAVETWKNTQAAEHYSASKRKAILPDTAARMRPEDTALSGTSPSGRLCLQLLEDSASVRSREGSGHRHPTQTARPEQRRCAPPALSLPSLQPVPAAGDRGQEATSGGVRSSDSSPGALRTGQVRIQPTTEGGPARGCAPGGADDT